MRPENLQVKIEAIEHARVAFQRAGKTYVPPREFTCDDCEVAPQCAWAFDDYNTGGDCLAIK